MRIYLGDLLDLTAYDGKKYTWKSLYDFVYKDNFDTDEELVYKNKRYQRYSEFKYKERVSMKMYFSGDIIFNFLDDEPSKRGKRRLYSEMRSLLKLAKEKCDSDLHGEDIKYIEELLAEAKQRTKSKATLFH